MAAERAAIVTGASSGIGLAIANVLVEEGYAVTMAARRPDKLEAAVAALADQGHDVQAVPANVLQEEDIQRVVQAHRERHGRLDVLVNNAGVGYASPVSELETKWLDMQLNVNLRSIALFYRESIELLKAAGAEHKNALVVNTASIAGKRGVGGNAVYSATKHAVVGWNDSMNRELNELGIKNTALCPAWVDTPMTDFIKDRVQAEAMIRPTDVSEAVRYLLKLSPMCLVPELMFVIPGDTTM
jgi:NAD(P)-dependent dehydrogenase (short-subunit alcohol dehydrogenase family)